MTGTTALLLYLAATFGSMALPYGRKKGSGKVSNRVSSNRSLRCRETDF
jgi:hypothetical protein